MTDQPRERPSKLSKPEKHVILSLVCPPSSHVDDLNGLVSALFPFIDSLTKVSLRPETKTKLKKVRETFEKTLKVEAEQAKKEEVCFFPPCSSNTNWIIYSWSKRGKTKKQPDARSKRKEYLNWVLQSNKRYFPPCVLRAYSHSLPRFSNVSVNVPFVKARASPFGKCEMGLSSDLDKECLFLSLLDLK